MRRFLFVLAAAVATTTVALADDVFGGWFTITKGSIRQADGSVRKISNLHVPYWVRPVGKTKQIIDKMYGRETQPWENPSLNDTLVRIYQNDNPNQYFGGNAEGHMCSGLDDIRIAASGVNAGVLDRLTVGWQIPSRTIPFVVFGFYDNYLPSQPAGQTSYNGIIVDSFGGPFLGALNTATFPVVPGEYMVTFGTTIASLGITFQDDQAYFFQQFRNGNENGPFNEEWAFFFSGGGNPQIGMSDDLFTYDSSPLDGIYEEAEWDFFDGPPFQANFAMALDIESNVTFSDLPAASVTRIRGGAVSGNYTQTWSSNNGYLVVNSANSQAEYTVPTILETTTFAPQQDLTSLTFKVESRASIPLAQQRIALYNYALGTFVHVRTNNITTSDGTESVIVTGNLSQYVEPNTLEMKARLSYLDPTYESALFTTSLDLIQWRVGTL